MTTQFECQIYITDTLHNPESQPDKKLKLVPYHEFVPIVGEYSHLILSLNTSYTQNGAEGSRVVVYDVNIGDQVYEYFYESIQDLTSYVDPKGSKVLLMCHQLVDETGLSYYGNNTLTLFSLDKFKRRNIATLVGPIHAVAWSPTGTKFVVTSGNLPARTIFYNEKGDPEITLGVNRRNTLSWSPTGRYLAVCGFGNLNGDVDIWDIVSKSKVGSCKLSCASYLKWSHQGDHFVCAIVTPKLREDNKYRVYNYKGTLLAKVDVSNSALYNVFWVAGGYLDADTDVKAQSGNTLKKVANFSRDEEDFMSANKVRQDRVQPITTKDIRNLNDEFLLSKGIKPPEKLDTSKKDEATKPRRAPGAPSPEPAKKKKKPKKKKEEKPGMQSY